MLPASRTLDRLHADLALAARITGASLSAGDVARVLDTFRDGLLGTSVQLRTTSKPLGQRQLCFRYLDLVSGEHPLDLAYASGELSERDDPTHRWLLDVRQRFGALGYGVDFEADRGLAKIWQFLDRAWRPVDLGARLAMPPGFAPSLGLLEELGLDAVTIVGTDYLRDSINLYFRPPAHDVLARACERLGFPTPSRLAVRHAAQAGCIAFTYGWRSAAVERICFYVSGFSRGAVPAYDPIFLEFAAKAPALVDDPRFIVSWSHGRGGHYFKLEDDYTGDVSEIFTAAMTVPPALSSAALTSHSPPHQLAG